MSILNGTFMGVPVMQRMNGASLQSHAVLGLPRLLVYVRALQYPSLLDEGASGYSGMKYSGVKVCHQSANALLLSHAQTQICLD